MMENNHLYFLFFFIICYFSLFTTTLGYSEPWKLMDPNVMNVPPNNTILCSDLVNTSTTPVKYYNVVAG